MKKWILVYILTHFFLMNLHAFSIYGNSVKKDISVSVAGKTIKGTYSIWYGAGNPQNKILKPFIVCEGFDPLQNVNADYVLNNQVSYNFAKELNTSNYDIIVLDLENNTGAIENNAELFSALINKINAELKTNKSYYRLNVMGISMGGLIIRYALAKMEKSGIDHRVENYISFDSPHLGANVPLGLQHMLHTFLGPTQDMTEMLSVLNNLKMKEEFLITMATMSKKVFGCNMYDFISNGINTLDYSAAFQMSAVYLKDNIWRKNFLANLESVGSFPTQCRSIGVSVGSLNQSQGFSNGDILLQYKNNFTLVNKTLDLGPFGKRNYKWVPLNIQNTVYLTPGDNAYNRVYSASFSTQTSINGPIGAGGINISKDVHDKLAAPIDCNLDNAKGAYLELPIQDLQKFLTQKGFIDVPFNLKKCVNVKYIGEMCIGRDFSIKANFNYSDILGTISGQQRYCFVPTLSALAIKNTNWNKDISSYGNYPGDKTVTPFDAICSTNQNNYHAQMPTNDNTVMNFINNEIQPEILYIQNRNFNSTFTGQFEATQKIIIGNDVDPVVKRRNKGDVVASQGSISVFNVPQNGQIVLKPGNSFKGNTSFKIDDTFTTKAIASTIKLGLPNTTAIPFSLGYTPNIDTTIVINSSLVITDNNNLRSIKNENFEPVFETTVSLYPNPIENLGRIELEIVSNSVVIIDILNCQGQLMQNLSNKYYTAGKHTENLNTENLNSGLYFCKISYEGGTKTTSFVVK